MGHQASTTGHAAARVHADSGARPAGAAARIPPFAAHQEGSPAAHWPLHSFLELGALAGAVPCARLHARHVLWEWGLADLADSAELLVSEMITNGVQASRAMTQAAVRLWLVSDRARVVILAWDASPLPPAPADPRADSENGRGLLLVDAISERWGWYVLDEQPSADAPGQHGKVVWAIVQLPPGQRPGKGDSNGDINAGERDDTIPGDRYVAAGPALVPGNHGEVCNPDLVPPGSLVPRTA